MNRTTTFALIALAALIVLLFALTGRPGGREFEEEPRVLLTLDGERRELGLEEYIKGVVGGEMGRLPAEGGQEGDWPHAAYAAQAILARSFALTFMTGDGTIEISTNVEEAQAYAPENITPAIERAVEATRGMVMFHRGEPVKAWFHSYSGGHTATAKEGLNYQGEEPGFIVAKEMPENEYVPERNRRWSLTIPLSEVSEALAGRGFGEVTGVEIAERGPSGRATRLVVTGPGGNRSIHAAELRLALGAERMRSTLLDRFEVSGGNLVMEGRGFGHGVGLSQWDAYKLAQEGRSAEEILHFFFKDIEIEKAWE